MDDEEFESLSSKQKELVLEALDKDPLAELEEVPTLTVQETDLHRKSKALFEKDKELFGLDYS